MGLGFVDIFALGAAIGSLHVCNNSRAVLLDGILIHTKSFGEIISRIFSFFGIKIVIGPGISLSMMVLSISFEITQYVEISSLHPTWTIRGLFAGLFLRVKILETASLSSAFAPNQYTVSVGKAITSHFSNNCFAI